MALDQVPDPLDETERFSRSRTCEHEHRTEVSLYRCSLGWGGNVRCKGARAGGDNRFRTHLYKLAGRRKVNQGNCARVDRNDAASSGARPFHSSGDRSQQ